MGKARLKDRLGRVCHAWSLFAGVALFLATVPVDAAGKRVAFVVGCDDYEHAPKLNNATADSVAVARLLRSLDFSVVELTNPGIDEFYEGLEKFKDVSREAEVGLFYFAGHGMEVEEKNYLLPVDAQLKSSAQLRTQAVNLQTVLNDLRDTRLPAKMVILDCCRDNPLSRSWLRTRSVQTGLATVKDSQIPPATMLMFAAAPGSPALDGEGEHSPFTSALLQHFSKPGTSAFDAFLAVSDAVATNSGNRQVPWIKFDGAGRAFRLFQFAAADPPPSVPGVTSMPGEKPPIDQIIAGKQIGPVRISDSPEEVARLLGPPDEINYYNGGKDLYYHYYEKGFITRFLHERVCSISAYSGKVDKNRESRHYRRFSEPLVPFRNIITLDSDWQRVASVFGDAGNHSSPDENRRLTEPGIWFDFLPSGELHFVTVLTDKETKRKWQIEAILGDRKSVEQSEKLQSLFRLGGLVPGDGLEDALQKWGQPSVKTYSDDLDFLIYFVEGDMKYPYGCHIFGLGPDDQGKRVITRFRIDKENAAKTLAERFGEPWFSLFGAKRSVIEAALGESAVKHENKVVYRFTDGVQVGEITFLCYPFREHRCSQIELYWVP